MQRNPEAVNMSEALLYILVQPYSQVKHTLECNGSHCHLEKRSYSTELIEPTKVTSLLESIKVWVVC